MTMNEDRVPNRPTPTRQPVVIHPDVMSAAQVVIEGLIRIDDDLDGEYDVIGPVVVRCANERVATIEWIDDCWQLVVQVPT